MKVESRRCAVIGASPETDIEVIRRCLRDDDFIACADGGYVFARKAGREPDLIVGDFDSSEKPENRNGGVIYLPVRKDDTDTMYIVRECLKLGFSDFLLLGMTGGRPDHTFANFCTLSYIAENGAHGCMADGRCVVEVIGTGKTIIENKKDSGFSVFPFGCSKCRLSLKGFEYELEDGELTEDFPLGVSNRIISDKAEVVLTSGKAILFIGNQEQ